MTETSLVPRVDVSPSARADASPEASGTSPRAALDASLTPGEETRLSPMEQRDMSSGAVADASRLCAWCRRSALEQTQLRYCSKRCRQTAYRFRKLAVVEGLGDATKRLAFADPPYIGLSLKYYRDEPTFRGEVDHVALVRDLLTFDGWALSCSRDSLPYVLSLIPRWVEGLIVCPWVKVIHRSRGRGPLNIHEYVVVVPARRRFPGVPDALVCSVAKGGDSDLMGRKPLAFVAWLFRLLGALPVDTLDDKFPGSEVVSRCWREFQQMGMVQP
jgi:hypothetical protein